MTDVLRYISDVFHEGGWPMWPIAWLGCLTLLLSIAACLRSYEGLEHAISVLVTVAAGVLGFLYGANATFADCFDHCGELRWLAVHEAARDLQCALLGTTPAVLLTGARRWLETPRKMGTR